jgi:hypothetical protein
MWSGRRIDGLAKRRARALFHTVGDGRSVEGDSLI